MGLLSSLLERRSSPENPATNLSNPASWLIDWMTGGGASKTGLTVNEDKSLQVSTVYACVRILAETIGSLPLHVYKRLPKGKAIARDHPLYKMLHSQANIRQTSVFFRETIQGNAALWGNGYAYIEKKNFGFGSPTSIVPLDPRKVTVTADASGAAVYTYRKADGSTIPFHASVVLHIPALSTDGISGLRPVALLRDAIGLAMATEEHGSRLFANSARPSGILTSPSTLKPTVRKELMANWQETQGSLAKSSSTALLEGGLTWTAIGIPPEDAQFLQTRKFQVSEIARIFRVPPHLVGDLEKATFSNIEHQSIDFVVHTIRPWLVRWEQEINVKLLDGGDEFFAEFNVDGLLRGDIVARMNAYKVGRDGGWLSVNDIRELENMNPVGPEGDVLLAPLNMVPLDQLGMAQAEPEPDPPAEPEPEPQEPRALPPPKVERRSLAARRRAARASRHAIRDAVDRITRHEVRALRRIAGKVWGQPSTRDRDQQLTEWGNQVAEFYADFSTSAARTMRPPIRSLVETIAGMAADDVRDATLPDDLDDIVAQFIDDYAASFGVRHSSRGRAQMKGIAADGVEASAIAQAISDRLDEWESTRPDRMTDAEVTRASNGASWVVWTAAAVAIVWYTSGSEPCDVCTGMDGVSVSGGEAFASAHDPAPSSDNTEQSDIAPRGVVRHPPLHEGCDCSIGPG